MNLKLANLSNLLSQQWCNWNSHRKYGDHFPGNINIETSTVCNRACYYCANATDPAKKQEYISSEVFSRILANLKDMRWSGNVSFNFVNEPLLDPNLVRLVRLVRRTCPRSRLIVYSNGDNLDYVGAGMLNMAGLDEIWVTEHPPYTEKWQRRMAQLQACISSRFLVVRRVEDLPYLHTFTGRGKPKQAMAKKRCDIVRNSIQILVNGDVLLCCAVPRKGFVQGNVMENTLLEIWNRQGPMQQIRENARRGANLCGMCRDCLKGTQ